MNYRIRNAGKSAELYLYDFIGGWMDGITAKRVVDDVKALGKIETLNVHINSPGGDVFEGFAIYNVLKQHPADVIVDIDGMAASVASVISMAGDTIRMADNALMMIHNPMGGQYGTAEELRAKADLMDQIRDNMIATYDKRTKLGATKIAELADAETWMNAAEAKRLGFIDDITDELQMAACFDLSSFKNAPKLKTDAPRANPFRARLAANDGRLKKVLGR